jgi:hypothetical protein
MAEFGSVEHVKSLSRRKLENLFRYVFNSRNDLNTIITQQNAEITELRRKVANQSKQLKAVQMALERRNQGEFKARWQRKLDMYRALVYDLQTSDGWPDDEKIRDYGIDPNEVHEVASMEWQGRVIE